MGNGTCGSSKKRNRRDGRNVDDDVRENGDGMDHIIYRWWWTERERDMRARNKNSYEAFKSEAYVFFSRAVRFGRGQAFRK